MGFALPAALTPLSCYITQAGLELRDWTTCRMNLISYAWHQPPVCGLRPMSVPQSPNAAPWLISLLLIQVPGWHRWHFGSNMASCWQTVKRNRASEEKNIIQVNTRKPLWERNVNWAQWGPRIANISLGALCTQDTAQSPHLQHFITMASVTN